MYIFPEAPYVATRAARFRGKSAISKKAVHLMRLSYLTESVERTADLGLDGMQIAEKYAARRKIR